MAIPLSRTSHCPTSFKTICNSSSLHPSRHFHPSPSQSATPLPIPVVGPPPSAPLPAPAQQDERISRRQRHASILRQTQDLRSALSARSHLAKPARGSVSSKSNLTKPTPTLKRFWKISSVHPTPSGFEIHLDHRPVRTADKQILVIPLSKPHLAHAIALEWDLLTSAAQALRTHNIPLTSLATRAMGIAESDREGGKEREDIVQMVMKYLDTDTLLCWAPEPEPSPSTTTTTTPSNPSIPPPPPSLHALQTSLAAPIITHLTTQTWPSTTLTPILSPDSILPIPQSASTRAVIQTWVRGLEAWDLAALERGVLATKSLCVATRLLVEWSSNSSSSFGENRVVSEAREASSGNTAAAAAAAAGLGNGAGKKGEKKKRFGISEAAEACTAEVRWQTGMWGEVEDTHDVEREDLRRQLGSVVLMVS